MIYAHFTSVPNKPETKIMIFLLPTAPPHSRCFSDTAWHTPDLSKGCCFAHSHWWRDRFVKPSIHSVTWPTALTDWIKDRSLYNQSLSYLEASIETPEPNYLSRNYDESKSASREKTDHWGSPVLLVEWASAESLELLFLQTPGGWPYWNPDLGFQWTSISITSTLHPYSSSPLT